MGGMGKRSLTKKAWTAQRCFATDVRFLGRAAKRRAKRRGTRALRRQGTNSAAAPG